jgi:hypothetical protein
MDQADPAPVDAIEATFVDDLVAREVADALNRWFRWILGGSEGTLDAFAAFGLDSSEYGWVRNEDVDWEFGPHARAVDRDVRISIETTDTYRALSGLLRKLGAVKVRVLREDA